MSVGMNEHWRHRGVRDGAKGENHAPNFKTAYDAYRAYMDGWNEGWRMSRRRGAGHSLRLFAPA